MTKVELHVFDPGSNQCFKEYVSMLIRTRTRYCQVSLCVDSRDDVAVWREALADHPSVHVFDSQADVPTVPFHGELLVTLSSKTPAVFSAYKQTIDLVIDTESARESGRIRYRFYRDRGYPLRHIKVQEKEPIA